MLKLLSYEYKVELPHDDLRLLFIAARFHGSRIHEKLTAITGVFGPAIRTDRASFGMTFHLDVNCDKDSTLGKVQELIQSELKKAKEDQATWRDHF
ncbi:MAG TPA: hypothetical protein VFW94_23780 [Candidatus Acidoferrales bacterium]|nr:hypothetical protein [Candidatus Acidoferrales bacterium]